MKPAYYNENDPKAAAWLRELINQNHIAPGDVDERDIRDVRPDDLVGYVQCHFFAGIGGWSLALRRAGWPDERPVWTGSCPCQPHSAAANRLKKGFADDRDLWPIWFDLVEAVGPDTVFGEQVDDSVTWIDRTLADLESAGFAVGAGDIPALAVDAPCERMRTFFVANTNGSRLSQQSGAIPMGQKLSASECSSRCSHYGNHRTTGEHGKTRRIKPGVRLLADGFPGRVAILRGFGNAINIQTATAFIEASMEAI